MDPITGRKDPIKQDGPKTGLASSFETFEDFWAAYETQTRYIIKKCVDLYEASEEVRAKFCPTPYLSCLVKGCADQGLDVTQGGAEINLTTLEARDLCHRRGLAPGCKTPGLRQKRLHPGRTDRGAQGQLEGSRHPAGQSQVQSPQIRPDDDQADAMAKKVMDLWTGETWKHKTKSTGRRFRPGMLSWNYWVGDGYILPASPDGRPKGQFLSNAICPTNGADINGPTANANSVGKALGGKDKNGDWEDYLNNLPNGASHTMTFNPSILKDPEHKEKFKAFLRGYTENGGTALQINMLDPEMLREAQRKPQDYRHLLVRVTGYNAYFTSIGKELQEEVIARVSHNEF